MLYLWNTATKKQEIFTPVHSGDIGMYTCGPTVYAHVHIGNVRTFVMEDILQRALESDGLHVRRVLNITDIGHLTTDADAGDDKMEMSAIKSGTTVQDIAQRYTDLFLQDAEKMNIKIPAAPFLCKATDHIQDQIALIQLLEKKGYTYRIDDGIYFDTSKFSTYGNFGGQKLEEKEEGARVQVNVQKKNKSDFALWKFARVDVQRQMEWASPWGMGFPGWHIECSAMAHVYLGQPFDIHCGGIDLIPVHHENEIAQSEAAYDVPLAKYWMHVEFLLIDGGKMSKSLGNVYTISDIEHRGFDPVALRLFFLGCHYRQKQNFTWDAVQANQNALQKLRSVIRTWKGSGTILVEFESEFKRAIADDLNTPKALAIMWKLVDSVASFADKAATILKMDEIFGLSLSAYVGQDEILPQEVLDLAFERIAARENKNWIVSDALRKKIEDMGYSVSDGADGQKVSKI